MNKKDEMLSAALRLFTANGYENVGIQKIVEAVSVKKPTLYYYFGSKQGLLVTLLEQYFDPFLEGLAHNAVYSGDMTLTLENIVKTYFRFATKSPDLYRFALSLMYSSEQSEARKTIFPFVEQQYAILEDIFRSAEQDHGNMRGRSTRYAVTFLGMVNAYITTNFYDRQITLNDERAHIACQQYMYGIFS
ncbi:MULTISPECIES: TetR/AcrR family transcriptional regulator [unclassified Agarivorans]|uniref:TetR/AcrR family transcriptional regulator n=1 Tax=unclassified Agarivorans TaxID=2636026 RepID=UPI003D7D992C